jgi:Mg-chelatase subunit ChlI
VEPTAGGEPLRRRVEVAVGDRLFNGRMLLEQAATEIKAASSVDPAELGVAVAAAADVLQALTEASGRLEVRTADVPDLAAMHAWSLRLLDKGSKRRRGLSWLGR